MNAPSKTLSTVSVRYFKFKQFSPLWRGITSTKAGSQIKIRYPTASVLCDGVQETCFIERQGKTYMEKLTWKNMIYFRSWNISYQCDKPTHIFEYILSCLVKIYFGASSPRWLFLMLTSCLAFPLPGFWTRKQLTSIYFTRDEHKFSRKKIRNCFSRRKRLQFSENRILRSWNV